MLTLSYGYKKPQNGDTGDVWFPAMSDNMQMVNDHTHNGTNSAPLASREVDATSGSWVAVVGSPGTYRQLVTVPTGLSYDTCQIWAQLSGGEPVYPTLERASATTFYVYTNDNSVTITLFFR